MAVTVKDVAKLATSVLFRLCCSLFDSFAFSFRNVSVTFLKLKYNTFRQKSSIILETFPFRHNAQIVLCNIVLF